MNIRNLLCIAFILINLGISVTYSQGINYISEENEVVINFLNDEVNVIETPSKRRLNYFKRQCSRGLANQRLFQEYGALFSATRKVALPDGCFFKNEAEVQRFQKRASYDSRTVNGVRIQLQPYALKAFLKARKEARKFGLQITPKVKDASRRSYAETMKFWKDRVNKGLDFWVKKNKITKRQARWIRALPIKKQVFEILKLEQNRIYFGTTKKRTILQSVAAPGGSQHNFMLALDIEQHSNPKVRKILAKHGWYQTIKNDTPHFTYLGLKESELKEAGLKRTSTGGRRYWVISNGLLIKNNPKTINNATWFLLSRNIPATASSDVLLPLSVIPIFSKLAHKYYARTGRKLHLTSAFRTPERQIMAMFYNLKTYGIRYVARQYRGSSAAWEIIRAYQTYSDNRTKAIKVMVKLLRAQIKRGIYLSKHLFKKVKAFDIRSRGKKAANLRILRSIVTGMRGKVLKEGDHYHVEF